MFLLSLLRQSLPRRGVMEEFLLIVLWSVTGGLSKLLIASSFSLQPTVVTGPRLGSALPSFCLRI